VTQAERLTLDGLNGHVIELKGDVGELKADVRAIKEALAQGTESKRHWNIVGASIVGALLSAASLVGLERMWPGH
jgi:hypothetical protein